MVDRKGPCSCGSGKKYKNCCWARDRAATDERDTARKSHEIIDGVLGVLLPLVESRGEHVIACRAGCNACCVSFVRVTEAQAALLAEWLLEPEHRALLDRFVAHLPGWRERAGEKAAAVEAELAQAQGAPAPPRALADAVLAYERLRIMCPFNDEAGSCAVYPVRPMPCRTYNVVGTSANCGPDPPGPAAVISHPSLSEAIGASRALLDGAARRSGKPTVERNLMNALADALRARGVDL